VLIPHRLHKVHAHRAVPGSYYKRRNPPQSTYTYLSRVNYTSCAQHVACCRQQNCCRQQATSCKQQATCCRNTLLVRATCCRATCCAGVNAALDARRVYYLKGQTGDTARVALIKNSHRNSQVFATSMRYPMAIFVVSHTQRRLSIKAAATDIVNFSPLCPTIQSGPLKIFTF